MNTSAPFRWVLPLIMAAGAPAPAATVAVRQTILERPFIWQNGDLDPATGEAADEVEGYRALDVDGDGRFDLGFLTEGYYPRVNVLLNSGVETFNYADIGRRAGYLVHVDSGTLLGASNAIGHYNWWRGDLGGLPEDAWNEEFWGEIWPRIEGPWMPLTTYAARTPLFAPTNWAGHTGYVGFRIQKEDGWHYGWVYVEQDADLPFVGGTIIAYAYETDPEVPILAIPEPRSAWLAAILPLTAMRRRRPEPRMNQAPANG